MFLFSPPSLNDNSTWRISTYWMNKNSEYILLLTFFSEVSLVQYGGWSWPFCKWRSITRNLYVPSCVYQMFKTITDIENHSACSFKSSASMICNLFLITMWYTKKSNGGGEATVSLYLKNTTYKIIALVTSFPCFLSRFLLGLFLDFLVLVLLHLFWVLSF